MARTAICSALCSNLPALRAMLTDAEGQQVDRFVFLGDATSAGPNPYECLSWIHETCDWCFTGFWDRFLEKPNGNFASSAVHTNETVYWNREIVLQYPDGLELIQFAASQDYQKEEGDVLFVHGSVIAPRNGFLLTADRREERYFDRTLIDRQYGALPEQIQLCFVGGRFGLPGVIWPDGLLEHESVVSRTWGEPGSERAIVNVGSVGLPKDHDPRACYVVFDDVGRQFSFRRVPYDVEEVVKAFQNALSLSARCREWMIQRHRDGV